ncbi:MAG TPA: hypothetical protein GX692_03595 [Acholeplasmataceae bacterium]|jgi:hypothetical protein|nr:hypothetical protein [Acholeplasmataceae bacterium]
MRKFRFYLFVILSIFLFLFIGSNIRVNADVGPKPSVNIKITGLEGEKYTATLISQKAGGPNFTYEDWLENGDPEYQPYHRIMEYRDSEGFKWIGSHWELEGDTSFVWGYYPPSTFKVLIMLEDGTYFTSPVLERYAFNTYYHVIIDRTENIVEVKKNYDYTTEIISLLLRLLATVLIEIGILYLFGYRNSRSYKLVLIVNIITQIFLNVLLNITSYYQSVLVGVIIYILLEFLIVLGEAIIYGIFLKEKKKWLAVVYAIAANIASFGIGLLIYLALA